MRPRRPLHAVLTLAAVLLTAVGVAPPSAHAAPAGSLIAVGGALADGNTEVYGEFVRLAGGATAARIGVITAASVPEADDPDAGDPQLCSNSVCNGRHYVDLLRGTYRVAAAEWIPVDLDRVAAASDPAVVARVATMTGFVIGGGDQTRLITTLQRSDGTDSPVLAAVRARHAAGAVVLGTSAGAAVMNGPNMVTGGESWDALRYGPTTDQDPPGRYDLTYLPRGGFNLFTDGLVDTHFGARGRQGRIVRLAAAVGATRAYGIDENTALVVTGDTQKVLGTGGVHVLDLRNAVTGTRNGYWSIDDVRWTYLTRGDTYRPSSWTMSTAKAAYRPTTGYAPDPPEDVFSSPRAADPDENRLTLLALGLVRAGRDTTVHGETHETGPVYEVNLTENGSFAAYRSGSVISFARMRADIRVS